MRARASCACFFVRSQMSLRGTDPSFVSRVLPFLCVSSIRRRLSCAASAVFHASRRKQKRAGMIAFRKACSLCGGREALCRPDLTFFWPFARRATEYKSITLIIDCIKAAYCTSLTLVGTKEEKWSKRKVRTPALPLSFLPLPLPPFLSLSLHTHTRLSTRLARLCVRPAPPAPWKRREPRASRGQWGGCSTAAPQSTTRGERQSARWSAAARGASLRPCCAPRHCHCGDRNGEERWGTCGEGEGAQAGCATQQQQ